MVRSDHIQLEYLEEADFDSPLGASTGAATIFGATGGVMDAALRSAYFLVTGKNPDADTFKAVRGLDREHWKEAEFTIPGAGVVRVAVVSSLGRTRKLLEAIKRGEVEYDFVEVMACPGGCAGGGGQPIQDGKGAGRVPGRCPVGHRQEHEGPLQPREPGDPDTLSGVPGGALRPHGHHLLHTDHHAWEMPLAPSLQKE